MGSTLPKGEACRHCRLVILRFPARTSSEDADVGSRSRSCRAKKRVSKHILPDTNATRLTWMSILTPQKCDAKRPCTRCIFADRALECEYDTAVGHTEHTPFVHWGEPDPSGWSDVSARERGVVGREVPGVFTNTSLVTITQPAPEVITPARTLINSFSCNSTSLYVSPKRQLHVFNDAKAHSSPPALLPPFSIMFSPKSSRIPPDPHVALLSLGAGRSQLSDAALGELDMKLYVPPL